MKIRHGSLAVVLAGALVVAACGDDDAETTPEPEGGDATSITMLTHDSFDVSDEVLAAFTEETGIAVEILPVADAGAMVNQAILTRDNPLGDVLYGIEVFIHPDYRGLRLGRRLYDARKSLCERLNLKAIVFGGRIPFYHQYAKELSPKEYIYKVKHKEIYDPVLSFQLANDFHVKKVLTDYLPDDVQSREFATLLQWDNIYYSPPSRKFYTPSRYVRLGLIQWQMRPYDDLDELFLQIEYFS